MLEEVITYLIAGGLGGIFKSIVEGHGVLMLPYTKDNKLYLGVLSSVLVGGAIGIIVDHSPVSALLGGYAGIHLLENLAQFTLPMNKPKVPVPSYQSSKKFMKGVK